MTSTSSTVPSWISTLTTASIATDMAAADVNGTVTYSGLDKLLSDLDATLTSSHTSLTTAEFNDLRTIAANLNNGLSTSAYLTGVWNSLVNGSALNATWTGGAATSTTLGNLAAGASATQLSDLIGKWFLGTDLPSSQVSMTGYPGFSVTYSTVANPLFGAGGPSVNDINQGYLGDCFFLACAAEVAYQNPNIISSMFTANGNGTYGVRFYDAGSAQYVTVNSALADGGTEFNYGANIWGSLAEKAYTQLQTGGPVTGNTGYGNSWSSIGNGGAPEFALEEITGATQITDYCSNGGSWDTYCYNSSLVQTSYSTGLSSASLLSILSGDLAAGNDLILSSNTNAYDGAGQQTLVADHAMSIYGYDVATGMLQIRNPWGTASGQYWNTTFEIDLATLLTAYDTITVDNVTSAPPVTIIQTDGNTSLAQVGSNYYFYAKGTTTGPELKLYGSPVVAGQLGAWNPIGAVQTASGYDVAWKNSSTGRYTVWATDASGNYTANLIGTVTASDPTLESFEPTFQQDLNGDGTIGLPPPSPPTIIQTDGNTSLAQVGSNYYFYAKGTTTGPELKYNGAAVTVGQFAGWAPIGAVQTASGYDIAWKNSSTNQYQVWATDSSGNYTSNLTGVVAANSYALESLESTLQQDLNGDGTVGVVATVIQTDGNTSLAQVGSNYFFFAKGTTTGPELMQNRSPVVAGQLGASWAPIGAVQTASGYDIAWKNSSTNQYQVWATDSSGNYTSNLTGVVAANSYALESLESTLQQDLNGDGTVGVVATVIQTDGATSLAQVGSNYFFFAKGTTAGPELKLYGSPIVAGQLGAWNPIGAVQTASGYDVAWKNSSTGRYTVWATDANGNYTANLIGTVTATDPTLESFEPTFQQDLNGDGTIGLVAAAANLAQAISALAPSTGPTNVVLSPLNSTQPATLASPLH